MDKNERDKIISEKLNEGFSLGEVQRQLAEEYGENLTYLDLRLIAAELDVDWEQQDEQSTAKEGAGQVIDEGQNRQGEASGLEGAEQEPAAGSGGTQVTVDKVTRADALMSGTVSFASGAKAKWFIDHTQQLRLAPEEGSEKPTQDDIVEFQQELQRVLQA